MVSERVVIIFDRVATLEALLFFLLQFFLVVATLVDIVNWIAAACPAHVDAAGWNHRLLLICCLLCRLIRRCCSVSPLPSVDNTAVCIISIAGVCIGVDGVVDFAFSAVLPVPSTATFSCVASWSPWAVSLWQNVVPHFCWFSVLVLPDSLCLVRLIHCWVWYIYIYLSLYSVSVGCLWPA